MTGMESTMNHLQNCTGIGTYTQSKDMKMQVIENVRKSPLLLSRNAQEKRECSRPIGLGLMMTLYSRRSTFEENLQKPHLFYFTRFIVTFDDFRMHHFYCIIYISECLVRGGHINDCFMHDRVVVSIFL